MLSSRVRALQSSESLTASPASCRDDELGIDALTGNDGGLHAGKRTVVKSGEKSGSNSAVECDLAKVEVAGSNPVSRSKRSKVVVWARPVARWNSGLLLQCFTLLAGEALIN